MDKYPKTILLRIWFSFNVVSTLISLASFADDFIAWVPFIKDIINSYREFTDFLWGNILSLFNIQTPQFIHDYLMINSLFALSITWGFYQTGKELGFSLASIRQVILNTFLDTKFEGNSFELFISKSKEELKKLKGKTSEKPEEHFNNATRSYPTFWLKIESVTSSIFVVLAYFTFSFILPFFIKWRELFLNSIFRNIIEKRFEELKNCTLSHQEKSILIKNFNDFCVSAISYSREHIKLYHKTFRKAILWYILIVIVLFFLLIGFNYLYNKFFT